MMLEPLAMEIYRRYLNGETVEELSLDLGIPTERIEQRLRAAAAYLERHEDLAA
jgi:DNA-directed RNA polymerase specialized sigma24 family protein